MALDPAKVFMFPESYNQLRIEMQKNHPALWQRVQWSMAFDAEMFVEMMNKELGGVYNPFSDPLDCDGWCSKFLEELKKRSSIRLQ